MGQHKSTRNRCNTCKVRKVKCDEVRPVCLQCQKHGHVCKYNTAKPAFDTVLENVVEFGSSSSSDTSVGSGVEFDRTCEIIAAQPRLEPCGMVMRFTLRTGPSLFANDPSTMYPETLIRLSQGRPYLKHAVLSVTIMHDWTLYGFNSTRAASTQAYHMAACARTLHARLSQPLNKADRDPLWASASLLMCASAANMSRALSVLDDLDWIEVCRTTANLALRWKAFRDGRLLMMEWLKPQRCWPIIGRPNSKCSTEQKLDLAIEQAMFDALPDETDLTRQSLVSSLQALLRTECTTETVFNFLAWFGIWPDSLLKNIRERNASAMLILAVWCTKTSTFRWWISHRATAILEEVCRYFGCKTVPNTNCQILLEYCEASLEQSYYGRSSPSTILAV